MTSYLERYLSGEHEQVWQELAQLGELGEFPGLEFASERSDDVIRVLTAGLLPG